MHRADTSIPGCAARATETYGPNSGRPGIPIFTR